MDSKIKNWPIGKGLVNSIIDKIPLELHLPGYQYCGPGTKVQKRVERGDNGINPLDAACKTHEVIYDKCKQRKERMKADKELLKASLNRIKSDDASLGEKVAAVGVSAAMKAKISLPKIGSGVSINYKNHKISMKKKKKKRVTKKVNKNKTKKNKSSKMKPFTSVIQMIKASLRAGKPVGAKQAIQMALFAAKKSSSSPAIVKLPQIIPIPKTGGMLPLIPVFAGLSAIGSLAGGTAGIVRAIGAASEAKKQLNESQRHNEMMEAIAIGKSRKGNGLYLKPYRKGYGLYLSPYSFEKNL